MRWKEFGIDGRWTKEDRDERASRTKVTRLDYFTVGEVPIAKESYTKSEDLKAALNNQASEKGVGQRRFRLFVVEDLSRDVIELLGAHYDIDPAFFRDQIFDYAWYNTRDRWADPPRLNIIGKRQRWLQIRFATARFFQTQESFKNGCDEFESFNVLRRPEDDLNNKAVWDKLGAIVGLSRTRASFWLGSAESQAEGAVGKWDFAWKGCDAAVGLYNWAPSADLDQLSISRRVVSRPNNQRRVSAVVWLS